MHHCDSLTHLITLARLTMRKVKYCVRSPIVPGVATTRRDDSGAWRPPPEAHTVNEAAAAAASASAPSFVGEMLNMTVPVGRDVDLDCQVKNAEGYKVSEHATTPPPAPPDLCTDARRRRFPSSSLGAFRSPFVRRVKSRPCRVPLPPFLPSSLPPATRAAPHPSVCH